MIPFFRKIRKKLADDNKPLKYMRYAVGEIALVVIGILIALSINNWNENRKEKENEIKTLENLLVDFESTLINLDQAIEVLPKSMESLTTIIEFIALDSVKISKDMKRNILDTGNPLIEIIDASLNALLNSGKLELISNDSLARLLTEYPTYVKTFKERKKLLDDVVRNQHRPVLEEYVSLFDLILGGMGSNNFPNINKRVSTSDYIGVINDFNYQNVLVKHYYHVGRTKSEAEFLQLQTKQIIDLINSELN